MPGRTLIIILFVVFTGCSAIKNQERTKLNIERKDSINLNELKERNLSGHDFYIQKAEIIVTTGEKKVRLLGSLKYRRSGTYLLSMKGGSGIEAARIMISNDTILVNDKINKRLYYGSSSALSMKYGISFEMLPLVLGDYINIKEMGGNDLKCNKGVAIIAGLIKGEKIDYSIDCDAGKVEKTGIYREGGKNGIIMEFSKLENEGSFQYFRNIAISDLSRDTELEISIEKIQFPEQVNIEFIPGSNYQKILLK